MSSAGAAETRLMMLEAARAKLRMETIVSIILRLTLMFSWKEKVEDAYGEYGHPAEIYLFLFILPRL